MKLEMAVEHAVKTAVTRCLTEVVALPKPRSWGTMEQSARPCQQVCRRAVVRQAGFWIQSRVAVRRQRCCGMQGSSREVSSFL